MADQFLGNLDDGEMWLPSDIFNTSNEVIPSKNNPQRQLSHVESLSQRFAAFTLRQRNHTPTMFSNLELFGPVVLKGTSVSADYFSSHGNPYTGGGGICTGLDPVQAYRSLNPVQAQVWRERERGMQTPERWFLRSRMVENRIVRVVGGGGVGLRGNGNGRGYGGTGVFLPDYTTITTAIPTGPRKRNGAPAKQVNQACLKRCSPKKAHASKDEECHFQLPQEWTY